MANGDQVTLFLCGDVMTGRGIDQVLPHPCDPRLYEPHVTSAEAYVALAEQANGPIPRPADFAYVWGDALEALARAGPDIRIVNLETSVTTSDACEPKGINYRMNPRNVGCLGAAAIDCCVLANNHVLDWGRPGLAETLATLAGAGIATAGAGRDARAAAAPAILDVPGAGRVLVYGFGSPTSGIPWDWAAGADRAGIDLIADLSDDAVDRIAARVRADKRPRDVAVASIHWGGNWGYAIPERQRRFAHALIDGAAIDVVHGHSSHHAKGIEVYNGRPILYGSGDFLNDYEGISGYEEYRDDLALMYLARIGTERGALVDLTMVPFRIRNFRLNMASRRDAGWLCDMLSREGAALGTGGNLRADDTLELVWA